MDVRRRVLGGTAAAAVVVALVAVLVITGRSDAPPHAVAVPPATSTSVTTPAPTPTPSDSPCAGGATAPFTPTSITVDGVLRRADVRALPRDANNVPGVPPVRDKAVFAWDRDGIRPGAARGNALFNAHTWPDGSAAGNALLRELEVGERVVLRGEDETLCYDVTERVEVRVEDGYPPYYDTEGPPQLAIVVCSGERRGPGDWSHRTLWFARPVA